MLTSVFRSNRCTNQQNQQTWHGYAYARTTRPLARLPAGHTAAELARKGGHDDVADTIAASAAEAQLAPLRAALAPGGGSAGHFDSTIARLLHVLKGAGLSIAETRGFGDDQDLIVVPDYRHATNPVLNMPWYQHAFPVTVWGTAPA